MSKLKSVINTITFSQRAYQSFGFARQNTAICNRYVHNQHQEESLIVKREVEEVRIPVPYGEIAGKWWGPKDVQPIVALHGWQDNAGTFDTLVPLLPQHISFLAIDFPGHGFSSRIPDGMTYHTLDSVYLLKLIMREYHWKKVSILAHSLGSIVGCLFSSIFPDKVDLYIGIDALKPHIIDPVKIAARLEQRIPRVMKADFRNRDKTEPPCYTYQELVDRLHQGTNKSVSKEAAPYLLNRNIKKSSMHPDKYYFTRDSRLKHSAGIGWGQDVNLELAKRMTMPYMFIKALHSPFYEDRKYFDEFVTVVKENNPMFELEFVDSTHHVHLTEPHKVAPMITRFLNKHWRREADNAQKR
ncbi:probable serine hydrolase [Toxorhynchites rutilus septentrionalis]|uniref:probable serine hydrolase n=1 Tax=Toxorhynchites rutilus septentrionalis TaxID=329112 RepID=UPI00247ACF11|nr:probable serine hydrolase [Toxorhynchites rutilus septentrionalis]